MFFSVLTPGETKESTGNFIMPNGYHELGVIDKIEYLERFSGNVLGVMIYGEYPEGADLRYNSKKYLSLENDENKKVLTVYGITKYYDADLSSINLYRKSNININKDNNFYLDIFTKGGIIMPFEAGTHTFTVNLEMINGQVVSDSKTFTIPKTTYSTTEKVKLHIINYDDESLGYLNKNIPTYVFKYFLKNIVFSRVNSYFEEFTDGHLRFDVEKEIEYREFAGEADDVPMIGLTNHLISYIDDVADTSGTTVGDYAYHNNVIIVPRFETPTGGTGAGLALNNLGSSVYSFYNKVPMLLRDYVLLGGNINGFIHEFGHTHFELGEAYSSGIGAVTDNEGMNGYTPMAISPNSVYYSAYERSLRMDEYGIIKHIESETFDVKIPTYSNNVHELSPTTILDAIGLTGSYFVDYRTGDPKYSYWDRDVGENKDTSETSNTFNKQVCVFYGDDWVPLKGNELLTQQKEKCFTGVGDTYSVNMVGIDGYDFSITLDEMTDTTATVSVDYGILTEIVGFYIDDIGGTYVETIGGEYYVMGVGEWFVEDLGGTVASPFISAYEEVSSWFYIPDNNINIKLPEVDLHAYYTAPDGTTGHIGMNYETGKYETIPEAITSGDKIFGGEYIFLPKDYKVEIKVDTRKLKEAYEETSGFLETAPDYAGYELKQIEVDATGSAKVSIPKRFAIPIKDPQTNQLVTSGKATSLQPLMVGKDQFISTIDKISGVGNKITIQQTTGFVTRETSKDPQDEEQPPEVPVDEQPREQEETARVMLYNTYTRRLVESRDVTPRQLERLELSNIDTGRYSVVVEQSKTGTRLTQPPAEHMYTFFDQWDAAASDLYMSDVEVQPEVTAFEEREITEEIEGEGINPMFLMIAGIVVVLGLLAAGFFYVKNKYM